MAGENNQTVGVNSPLQKKDGNFQAKGDHYIIKIHLASLDRNPTHRAQRENEHWRIWLVSGCLWRLQSEKSVMCSSILSLSP
jgi:hypothetical protein